MNDFKDYLYVTSSSIYIQKEMGSTTTFTRTVYVPPYLLDPHNDCKHAVPQILCELYCDICAYMSTWPSIQWNTVKHDDTINDIMWYFKMTISLPYITCPELHTCCYAKQKYLNDRTQEKPVTLLCVFMSLRSAPKSEGRGEFGRIEKV